MIQEISKANSSSRGYSLSHQSFSVFPEEGPTGSLKEPLPEVYEEVKLSYDIPPRPP